MPSDAPKDKGISERYCLRIAKKGMGCGVGFKLGFDMKKETDEEFIIDDVQVFVRKSEMMFVVGKKIEFYDEADAREFVFV